jgi:hypothetical protein
MAARDLEPELLLPNRRYWIVGPTYDLGEKEFRVVWDDLIVRRNFGKDKRIKKRYNKNQGEMFIEFPWGTTVEVRSADHPASLVGDALHGVIMSEAAKHKQQTWERYIRPALADYHGWATFPTTPEGHNWLYHLWQFGLNPDLPEYESWRFPSWDNPFVYPEGRTDPEILLLEKTTTPEWFMQEVGADFASFVGKIYDEFDETAHVKKVEYNPLWKNYIAFDWGFVNPLAAIEFQVSPRDDVYVWREHYLAYTNLDVHLRMLRQRKQPDGYHLDLAFGDAEDPAAAEQVSRDLVGCYAEPDAKKNWRQGVELVKTFLRSYDTGRTIDEHGTPEQQPKLFIDHSCVNLIREFQNYRAQEGTRGQNPKEVAQKIDDHALDALRYGLMHYFVLGARHHLNEVYTEADLMSSAPEMGYFVNTGTTEHM